MRRKNPAALLLVLLGCLLLAGLSQAKKKPQTVTCPSCPGGVCPVEYRQAEAHYTSLAQPTVDIPPEWRESNYDGGSCVHATTESLLRHVGLFDLAAWWRQTYSGGEGPGGLDSKMRAANLKFVKTTDGDVELLKWAVATRRGAGVGWPTRHCTAVVDICDGYVVIMDNNHTDRYTYVPWDRFVSEWQSVGGWAFALTYTPPPPTPKM